MKKSLVFTFLFSLFFSALAAQETLSNYNTSWNIVLPGNSICEPELTSYGYCLATDARNLMGYSSDGKLLWEKNIGRARNISLTTLAGDFILFCDFSTNTLKLFNPSGTEIWENTLSFKMYSKPFEGRDGRFFVHGENTLLCYGINGSLRWSIETANQKDLPLQELPDGSIVLFFADENGSTKGLRVSPFGEQLENITFAGSVSNCWTCSEGILLVFSDGSSGLFSIDSQSSLAVNKWVVPVKKPNSIYCVSPDKTDFLFITPSDSANSTSIYRLSKENGAVISKWEKPFSYNELLKIRYNNSGLFIADRNSACLYDSNCSEIWSAKMPDAVRNKSINYISYLDDDYLLFFNKNWSVNAYRLSQKTTKNQNTVLKNVHNDYSSYINLNLYEIDYYYQGSFYNSVKDSQIAKEIKQGNLGTKEQEYLVQTLSVAKIFSNYATSSDTGTRVEKPIFSTDSAGFEAILCQLSLLCTKDTQNAAANIIYKSTNKLYCKAILNNLSGYDPDGKLLEAIERNAALSGNKDTVYFKSICDAVYSICLFMGRPAYNKKGKEIIKKFMGVNYPSATRNYARDTLKKIMSLEL